MGAEYALALATGLVAAVNPCGFAMLPAYLSFLITDDAPSRRAALGRALALTAAMTAGFMAVFGVFGLIVAPLAGSVGRHLPWVTIGIGVLLVGLGGWLLAGRDLPGLPKLGRAPDLRRSAGSMTLFGAAYAIASLGCTIGPFLVVVAGSFRSGNAAAGIGLFLAYAAGMGLVVGTVAIAVAVARMSLIDRLRRTGPVIARAGGALMVIAGLHVAYYGWYSLRVFDGQITADPIIDSLARVQEAVAGWLDGAGPLLITAVFLALLATGAVVAATRRR